VALQCDHSALSDLQGDPCNWHKLQPAGPREREGAREREQEREGVREKERERESKREGAREREQERGSKRERE